MPSLRRHYPASIHSIGLRASTVLRILRTPCCHLPPLLARLVGHTRTGTIGLRDASKNFRASLVALTTCCVARMGLRLRVSDDRSPWRGHRYCLQACTHPGQDPTGTKISELNTIQGGRAIPLPFILTTFLCTLQPATSAKPLYTLAATLDTGPLARSYPGGIRTRSSSNHFQSARARFGSASVDRLDSDAVSNQTHHLADRRRDPRPGVVHDQHVPIA